MRFFLQLLLVVLLGSCSSDEQGFVALLNWDRQENGVHVIDLDYQEAFDSGFVIPTTRQVDGGRFAFRYVEDGEYEMGRTFGYKLYYLNETYRFPHANSDSSLHAHADENFYGSWETASEGFRMAQVDDRGKLIIEDSFRIHGDPRDETMYIDSLGRRVRWARNPRVGEYRFMLVIIPEEVLRKEPPPEQVTDLSKTADGRFIDPFWYWGPGPGSKDPRIRVFHAEQRLRVRARPDLGAGVHIRSEVPVDGAAFTDQCGTREQLRKEAPFEQFIHYVDSSTRFANIPVIADVLGNEYTPADHDKYRCFFPEDQMVVIRPKTTGVPCATVRSDPDQDLLELRNPASTYGHWAKENVGVRSRHGLTYGRYRVKCKLTRLLNDSDMWTGITNAIWLLYQEKDHMRRICPEGGYLSNYYGGSADARVPQVAYSEIDFEILKTTPYCPARTFPPTYPQAQALSDDRTTWAYSTSDARTDGKGMITVACTNWDMACPSPERFGHGCLPMEHDGRTFIGHRWDENYRAITQKSEALDMELFGGDHYWFEIDWRPQEIIWRIGPDLDNLRVVGYMDQRYTEISNVQMQLIITQEYHNTRWWPGTPYEQGYIPFPAKDLVGRILEVIID